MPTLTDEELLAPAAPPPEEQPPPEQQPTLGGDGTIYDSYADMGGGPVPIEQAPPQEAAPVDQAAPVEAAPAADPTGAITTMDVVGIGGRVTPAATAPVDQAPVQQAADAAATTPVPDPGSLEALAAGPQPGLSAGPSAGPTLTNDELAPPAPGPLQEAANAIGGAVAPLVSQLPDPVQNAANIIGQPVGGAIDAAQDVANQVGQGDIPGAIGAGLNALSGPQSRVVEQTTQRLEDGKSAIPSMDEILADPGNLLALQGGIATTYGPTPALSGLTLEDYYAQHRDELAGLSAAEVHDRWMQAAGAMDTPPAQLSNPLDAATSSNPIERAGQVAGAIPDFITGWGDSAQQGTLKPFVLGQVQAAVEDPLSLIPGAVSERLVGRAGEALSHAIPAPIRALGELTPEETTRLEGERLGASGTEYLTAAEAQAPPISPLTGRPLIEPGTLPEVETPLREQLDTVGLPDVGVQLTNDIRDADPTLAPTTKSHYDPATNTIHLALDTTAYDDLPGVLEREANTLLTNRGKQQAVTNAYATTPLAFQRQVRNVMPQDPVLLRTVQMSTEGAQMMAAPAAGRLKFRDNWHPDAMPLVDVAERLRRDTDSWLDGFDPVGNPIQAVQDTPQWKALNRRNDPNGVVDVRPMLGNSPRARQLRMDHSSELFTDAITNAQKVPARANKLGSAYATYTNAIRQSMLFNVLNVPRYIAQNLTTNTINIKVRGGGIRPAFDVFTDLGEMKRVFGNQRDPLRHTSLDSMLHQIGMGDRPNIKQNQRAYFDRVGQGTPPKWLDIPLRVVAPETVRYLASVPDVMGRVEVGSHALMDGFHELNKTLVPTFNEVQKKQLGRYGHVIPADKVQQVMGDFLKDHRTLIDQNTGLPQKGLLGRSKSLEPMWNPDDLGTYLRQHLDEDMTIKPDRGLYNRSINEMVGKSRDSVRGILDAADAKVDYALFPWRDTKGDAALGKATLFHYYMTRQGGFYVSEMMKHPWVAAAYGRMLNEMQQQNEELGGPAWLTGWFQFQQSVGGFSTWLSPTDFIQSLLTGAAFAQDADPDAWRDMTKLGEYVKGFPFFVHPALIGVGYAAGALGPQYPSPNLTGMETFGSKAIDLLNLANFQDAPFMKVFNSMGMGVDANGNKVPIPPRPLNELYARVGNALSTALAPITGLTPDEVVSSGAGIAVDVKAVGMAETRRAHPEWDTGEDEGEMQIDRHVTEVLADPNSPEYKDWYQKVTSEPFQMGAGWNPVVAGLARIASPIGVVTMPEQKAVDKMGGLAPSGQTPLRDTTNLSEDINKESLFGLSNTVEGRQLTEENNDFKNLIDPDLKAAQTESNAIAYCKPDDCQLDHDVEIAGTTYTPEELQQKDQETRYGLKDQYLTEQGITDEDLQQAKDDELAYLAEHPDLAAYKTYVDLVSGPPGPEEEQNAHAQQFVEQAIQTNPSFAQYIRSEATDKDTGEIDYSRAFGIDAFLAIQGVRGSEYSPLVGNDPSTAKGGYPSIPGVEEGQPLLPITNVIADAYIYRDKGDVVGGKYSDDPIAVAAPNLPIQTLGQPVTVNDNYNGGTYVPTTHRMIQVVQPDNPDKPVGWIDYDLLSNISPARPVGGGTVQQFGQGGLAETAGQVTDALGGAKDALLGGISGGLGAVGLPSLPTAAPTSAPAAPAQTAPKASEAGVVPGTPRRLVGPIQQAAEDNGVPPAILSAMLQQESNFKPNAINPSSGAQGIGQFMPETAAGLGIDPMDPNQAIPAAAQYLKQQYDTFGSWDLALAAYNAGAGNVQQYGGIPPFTETQNYVATIMGNANAVPPPSAPSPDELTTPVAEPAPAGGSIGDLLGGAVSGALNTIGGAKDALLGTGQAAAPAAAPAPSTGTPWVFSRPKGTTDLDAIHSMDTTTYAGAQQNPRSTMVNAKGETVPNVQGIVFHYTASPDIASFAPDFMGQTGRKASSNYVVDKDGTIYQFVDPDTGAAWANGDTNAPNDNAQYLVSQDPTGQNDANQDTVSIEIVNEGLVTPGKKTSTDPADFAAYTPEQLEAVQNLTNWLVWKYDLPADRQHLIAHSDINTVEKSDPGPLFPLETIIGNAPNVITN